MGKPSLVNRSGQLKSPNVFCLVYGRNHTVSFCFLIGSFFLQVFIHEILLLSRCYTITRMTFCDPNGDCSNKVSNQTGSVSSFDGDF